LPTGLSVQIPVMTATNAKEVAGNMSYKTGENEPEDVFTYIDVKEISLCVCVSTSTRALAISPAKSKWDWEAEASEGSF
jgi:hypothetical protein